MSGVKSKLTFANSWINIILRYIKCCSATLVLYANMNISISAQGHDYHVGLPLKLDDNSDQIS